jgi:streptogramin lyase
VGLSRFYQAGFAAVLATAALGVLAPLASAAPAVTEFAIPTNDTQPWGVTAGPDGNVWFTEGGKKAVAKVTPLGVVTEYAAGITVGNPRGITAGPDGNVWFTEASGSGAIASITPSGTVTEYTTGLTKSSQPAGIVAGPDGNLWFTESAGNGAIGRIDPDTGAITEFSTGLTNKRTPTSITAGPDGNLWFTEAGNPGAIGKITPLGGITEYTAGMTANKTPTAITLGGDGNLWFTENSNPGAIGQITPSGVITEFSTGLTTNNDPSGIAAANDGTVWFTEAGLAKLGNIAPDGSITEYTTGLTSNSSPWRAAAGPDGNLWFTEHANPGRIAQLTLPPAASTSVPTATSGSAATLAAAVTPNSQSTTYYFDWGASSDYGSSTSSASAGSGSSAQNVTASISGLTPGNTYHYRVVATNASGTTYGRDMTFTAQTMPIVETQAATDVAGTSAKLRATVDPNSFSTSYHFDWGTGTLYGSTVPAIDVAVGSDSTNHSVEQTLSGLTPGATYHYRVVAASSAGTSLGADETFTTPMPAPTVSQGDATAIGSSAATLNATANPQGSATSYHFDFGATTEYGSQWPSFEVPLGSDNSDHALAQTVSGLAPGTTYHYRLVAASAAGAAYGPDQTFTTAAAPVDPGPGTNDPGKGTVAPPVLPPATPPVRGRSVTLKPASGSVLVLLPGTAEYVPLGNASTLPVGTTIDATNGRVQMTDAGGRGGRTESALFWAGAFKVGQARKKNGYTDLSLAGATSCPAWAKPGLAISAARKRRSLWGRDRGGRYRTHGHFATATVRGTEWLTEDSCSGTTVKVKRGAVSVRDNVKKRTVLVHAGKSYRARASAKR